MVIEDLMSPVKTFFAPTDALSVIVNAMQESLHSCALIADAGNPVGIITERDIVQTCYLETAGSNISAYKAADIMTPDPVCVEQSSPLYEALVLARSRKLRHLPVTDSNNQLVGVVTQTDMIDAYVRLVEHHAELIAKNDELKQLAMEDGLLEIGNRRAMEVDLDFTAAHSHRQKNTYAVALLDVDYFKKYNDHYGHQAGDDALRALAQTVRAAMRDSDRIYRYGGEELLMLMPDTDIKGAQICADRLHAAINAWRAPHAQSPFGIITVSTGVAVGQAIEWKSVIAQADRALYRAKNEGRNRICCSEEGLVTQQTA